VLLASTSRRRVNGVANTSLSEQADPLAASGPSALHDRHDSKLCVDKITVSADGKQMTTISDNKRFSRVSRFVGETNSSQLAARPTFA